MKKRINKDLLVGFIVILFVLLSAFYFSPRKEGSLPKFSTLNKLGSGYSVFYETLKELKYPVKRTLSPVEDQAIDSVQIVASSGEFDLNSTKIKQWVKRGGSIVFLSTSNNQTIEYGVLPEYVGSGIAVYKYGNGRIIAGDAAAVSNETLKNDTEKAYVILKSIDTGEERKLLFNETYMFSKKQQKSLWGAIPLGIKFVIYQVILTVIAYFVYKGRRFGKPIPLHAEVERVENEYLFSAASIYRQARCWDLIVDSFYKSLLRLMKAEHDEWISKWERENLPDINRAKKVYAFMNNLKDSRGMKPKAEECEHIINNIDQLKNVLKKRRELHWKDLKRI